jgi:hypothetical protein
VEFMEADAVDNAIMLDNTELRGRPIKVRTAQGQLADGCRPGQGSGTVDRGAMNS